MSSGTWIPEKLPSEIFLQALEQGNQNLFVLQVNCFPC